MKTYNQLKESISTKTRTLVLHWSACNPPTLEHLVAFTATRQIAENINADYVILLSNNQAETNKQSPLTLAEKLEYTNIFFPGFNIVAASESMKTQVDAYRAYSKKYKNLIEVCGTTGAAAHSTLREQFDNHACDDSQITIVSTGEIEPDNSVASTKMLNAITEGDIKTLQKYLLAHVREIDAKRFMNDARIGMGLDAIKESIVVNTSALREDYIAGKILLENTFVESNNQLYKIINRNSNYITVSNNSGILSKKWLNDVQPVEVSEATRIAFEGITEMKFSTADKIKVGKIIGGMLGADVSKGSNAEQMVNAGLRITKTKALNAEAISLLQNMLKTADDAGIMYDKKLVPTTIKEAEMFNFADWKAGKGKKLGKPRGAWSEKNLLIKDKKTGEKYDPTVEFDKLLDAPDTRAQFKRMKDEQGKGWPKSKSHSQNEDSAQYSADVENPEFDPTTGQYKRTHRHRRHPISFTRRVLPDEVIGGRTTESLDIVPSGAGSDIQAPQTSQYVEKTPNLAKRKIKTLATLRKESADDVIACGDQSPEKMGTMIDVPLTKETKSKKKKNESIELDEAAVDDRLEKLSNANRHIQNSPAYTAHFKSDVAHIHDLVRRPLMKGDMKGHKEMMLYVAGKYPDHFDEYMEHAQNESVEIDEAKRRDHEQEHIDSIRARTEQAHLKGERYHTLYAKDQVVADTHHLHLNTLGGKQVVLPAHTSNTSESVDECTVDEVEATKDGSNITDAEIDDMIIHINDWDDIVSLYDSSELSYVDGVSGQHVAEVPDKFYGYEGDPTETPDDREIDAPDEVFVAGPPKMRESTELNEIMSRVERIKTDISHHSSRTKRPVKIVLKKRSTAAQLHRKARSLAVKTLKLNLAKKPLKQLTHAERARIEHVVATKTKLINRIAIRLLPRIKNIEQLNMSHSNYTKE